MNQIPSKIYYEVSNGNILVMTPEMQGSVDPTNKEKDMGLYRQLKDKNINELGFIELEYGTLATTFNNAKSYKVNLETKQLEVIHYTQQEMDVINQQNQEIQDFNSRLLDISQYLQNQDIQSISGIEDYILQSEIIKITGGM